jgi:hypothetical protein
MTLLDVREDGFAMRRVIGSTGDTGCGRPELRDSRVERVLPTPGDDHGPALCDQPLRHSEPDAATRAGDQSHRLVEAADAALTRCHSDSSSYRPVGLYLTIGHHPGQACTVL